MRAKRMLVTVLAAASVLLMAVPPASAAVSVADACPSTAPDAGFTDSAGRFRREIDCVAWWDVAQGVTSRQFEPEAHVTREQMATFVRRMVSESGGTFASPGRSPFTDVSGGTHGDNILRLNQAGIVNGTTSTTYSPRDVVTREQMASFLARAWEFRTGSALPSASNPFSDVSGTHADNIARVANAGIAQGIGFSQYDPKAPVTRGQMAAFLARTLSKLVADGYALPPVGHLATLTPRGQQDCPINTGVGPDMIGPWQTTNLFGIRGETPLRVYPNTLQCRIGEGTGWIEYNLPPGTRRLQTNVGIDYSSAETVGTATFRIRVDGRVVEEVDTTFDRFRNAQRLNVDVSGGSRLRLEVQRVDGCANCLARGMVVGFGEPTLHR